MEDRLRGLVKQLPSNIIAKELVDVFFSEANWYFGVLERHYFDKLHNAWYAVSDVMLPKGGFGNILRDLQYFPALLFQVLAVALQYLPPNTASAKALHLEDPAVCDRLSQEYSRLGMDIMALLGRHNSSLTAVQQDLMRALWLKNCSRGTESWYSLGDAIREALSPVSIRSALTFAFRQAQDLGLHLQCSVHQEAADDVGDTLTRLWYDEYKRRLWVTLFIWDRSVSPNVLSFQLLIQSVIWL